jgi:5-amino-6-(5-phosphoribosylamino)uracil reductase
MAERPYTVLSCAVSVDGYLDSAGASRLLLSNEADVDRVDALRASCDAILVGAGTIRADDPRLMVRAPERRRWRVARGLPGTPTKVTVTRRARLDATANFFACGDAEKLVYCASDALAVARRDLRDVATVLDAGRCPQMRYVCEDLAAHGVQRLMVEGGGTVLTQFLTAGLADELQLVIAPLFVGDSRARRFVDDGRFPWHSRRRATVAEVRRLGDVVLIRYALSRRAGAPCPPTG